MKGKDIKKIVKEGYAKIAKNENSCCALVSSCCGNIKLIENISKKIGYRDEELKSAPEGANLGLGCGNPVNMAYLREGEIVLDLGSGAGFDCFLAANKVGKNGKVIGVDMTPEMIEKARENIKKGNYENVEFRLGEIENIPVADNSVDVIISNCVINLSPDKKRVFQEALRVLKPGGRLVVSDIVLLEELPDFIRNSIEAYIGCISGAIMKDKYIESIRESGFHDVEIIDELPFHIEFTENGVSADIIINNKSKTSKNRFKKIGNSVVSIKVRGEK